MAMPRKELEEKQIFNVFDCTAFEDNSLVSPATTREFMTSSLGIECGSPEHNQLQALAYFFGAIWPFGVPLTFLAVLETLAYTRRVLD